MTSALMSMQEVANALKLNVYDFAKKRHYLTSAHNFPKKRPGLGLVWSRAEVEAWIANKKETPLPPPSPIAVQRAELEQEWARPALNGARR